MVEAVHVLVGATLPGGVGKGKEEIGIESPRNPFVLCELLAVVGGQRMHAGREKTRHGIRQGWPGVNQWATECRLPLFSEGSCSCVLGLEKELFSRGNTQFGGKARVKAYSREFSGLCAARFPRSSKFVSDLNGRAASADT